MKKTHFSASWNLRAHQVSSLTHVADLLRQCFRIQIHMQTSLDPNCFILKFCYSSTTPEKATIFSVLSMSLSQCVVWFSHSQDCSYVAVLAISVFHLLYSSKYSLPETRNFDAIWATARPSQEELQIIVYHIHSYVLIELWCDPRRKIRRVSAHRNAMQKFSCLFTNLTGFVRSNRFFLATACAEHLERTIKSNCSLLHTHLDLSWHLDDIEPH